MTPQERLVLLGAATVLAARFFGKQNWMNALTFGFGAISAWAILQAHDSKA